jgi:hypothetical protein
MAYIGKTPVIGNFQVCDAISVVNNQAAYTMQVSSVDVFPESANHMLVSLNGILQAPTSSFTVSGSTITFASNLVTGDVIDFIQILGNVLDLGVPSDNTVTTAKLSDSSVTTAKLNDASVSLAKLTATGTKNGTTFLRGDNTFAEAGGGKVLQVVTATDSTVRSTTSGSFVTASNTMSVNITPSSASSKIFVVTSGTCYTDTANQRWRTTIYRDSTNLDGGDSTSQGLCQGFTSSTTSLIASSGMTILDSPNTTSEVTYQVYFRRNDSGTVYLNEYQVKGSITAFEIGA